MDNHGYVAEEKEKEKEKGDRRLSLSGMELPGLVRYKASE